MTDAAAIKRTTFVKRMAVQWVGEDGETHEHGFDVESHVPSGDGIHMLLLALVRIDLRLQALEDRLNQ